MSTRIVIPQFTRKMNLFVLLCFFLTFASSVVVAEVPEFLVKELDKIKCPEGTTRRTVKARVPENDPKTVNVEVLCFDEHDKILKEFSLDIPNKDGSIFVYDSEAGKVTTKTPEVVVASGTFVLDFAKPEPPTTVNP